MAGRASRLPRAEAPPRSDARQGAERPSGFGPRPLKGKPHRHKLPADARPFASPPPPEDRPRSERPKVERAAAERQKADRPRTKRPFTEQPFTERPRIERPRTERPAPEAEADPRGKGRDRRGLGDTRVPRQIEAPPPPREPRPSQAAIQRDAPPPNTLWLHGIHAVAAAMANPRRRLKRLFLTVDAEAALTAQLPQPWRITPERVERNRFQTFLNEDAVHQGAALLTEPLAPIPLEEALAASPGPVLLLDQVTDPRNVGAILRSAAAFGAACVVMQDRNAAPETGALARAASGALELVPIAREVNLSRAIVALQKAGFWVLGLAGDGKRTLAEAVPRDRRTALVLGAEDSGMRRLQRETCDELVRLPIAPGVESLNVAAAAAVALYEIIRVPPEPQPEREPQEGPA